MDRDRGERFRVSRDGGYSPTWRGDGREIFCVSLTGEMMAVPVDMASTSGAPIGEIAVLFAAQLNRPADYDVIPGGQRFLLTQKIELDPVDAAVLVQSWVSEP